MMIGDAIPKGPLIWAWAPGTTGNVLPEQAGIRILGTGIKSLVLQVHYDNVGKDTGKIDSSGFRMYYTAKLRANDASSLILGDPGIILSKYPDKKIPIGMSRVTFKNEADCTNKLSQEVTVFQRFMHMHEVGTHMRTRHYRQNSLLREDIVDFYDFKQAGGVAPRSTGNGFKIKPGDRFEVPSSASTPKSIRTASTIKPPLKLARSTPPQPLTPVV